MYSCHIDDIKTLTSELRNEFNKFLFDYKNEHLNESVFYHNTELLRTLELTSSHKCLYFSCRDKKNKLCALLPVLYMESKLFGSGFYSVPYFNYGGIVAHDMLSEDQLIKFVYQYAQNNQIPVIQLRESKSKYENLLIDRTYHQKIAVNTEKVNMVLPLPDEVKKIGVGNAKKRAKLRSQAGLAQRKADELNISLEQKFGSIELLDDFYQVFAHNMRDLGTPVYGKSFFEDLLLTYEQYATISIVYWDKKPVSCAFLFSDGVSMDIPWASTLKTMNKYSLNLFMYWHILEYAIKTHHQLFDFGRSSKYSGTYKFKQQFGAEERQCFWYSFYTKEKTPELSPSNKKFQILINVWKKLPVWLTKIIGPQIVINLP